MNVLDIQHDLMIAAAGIDRTVKTAITKLQEARKLNEQMQKAHPGVSPEWHMHETIDDRLHDALTALGD